MKSIANGTREATSFDNYMNAENSVEFGICDAIITEPTKRRIASL
jgi:ATP-dependent protease ClpP protease subunit